MKISRFLSTAMMAASLIGASHAQDIDIYSGIANRGDRPNVLLIFDTAANFSASVPTGLCTYADGSGTPSLDGKLAGIEQCALYNVVDALPVNDDGTGFVNIGVMFYNSLDLKTAYGCGTSSSGGCLVWPLTEMDDSTKSEMKAWIASWDINQIKSNSEATAQTLQEAWAYYAGRVGVSGRDYASLQPAAGCQNNFVIFIGNAYDNNGSPGDGGLGTTSLAGLLANAPGVTAAQKVNIAIPNGSYGLPPANTSCGAYTYNSSHQEGSGVYMDEWARYMYQADLYSSRADVQSITTYAIGVLGSSCRPDYPALLTSAAYYGGGKYYGVSAAGADDLVSAIRQILNEVQAVNSVFSSSSLPVSVNAQGTYLNQIYMGMFRPDDKGDPRWLGNLKQYQFRYNPLTDSLQLADSNGNPAISAGGTGFITPNAVSYWTYRNDAVEPDLGGGFWRNQPGGAAGGYDSPDGQLVEKGGAAQVLRRVNLLNAYGDAAGTTRNPRNLYTYCPSGASCNPQLSDATNAFTNANAAITDAKLLTGARTITSITSDSVTRTPTSTKAGLAFTVASSYQDPANSSNMLAQISAADNAAIAAYLKTTSWKKQTRFVTATATYACTTLATMPRYVGPDPADPANFVLITYPKSCGPPASATPISAYILNNRIEVTMPNHGLKSGWYVTIPVAGCSATGGLVTMSGARRITVVNDNSFWFGSGIGQVYSAEGGCRYIPNIATYTSAAHGLPTGDVVTIAGATQTAYNGAKVITVTGDDTFVATYNALAPLLAETGTFTATSTTTRVSLTKWVRGYDYKNNELGPGTRDTTVADYLARVANIRPSIHGDVLHSRPVVINYGGSIGVVVFYGGNDGVYRAVNGNQTDAAFSGDITAGGELWGFIPPEFFNKLKRLHDNSPILQLPSTMSGIVPTPQKKTYFADGGTGVYQKLNSDGTTNTAYLYLAMRRGGRFIYALDVSTPTNPRFLWKKTSADTGFSELGQTWSQPKVAFVKGYTDVNGNPKPVLIFGAGYDDVAEDAEPPGARTMGRGIFILDAATGDIVWKAVYGATSSCGGTAPVTCAVAGMDYSIPADITLMDRSGNDGLIDRLYAVDVGGNVWRVDLEPTLTHTTPDYWQVTRLAALGCNTGACPSGTAPRKFFYPPDVVPTTAYDAVLIGSGDREHPMYSDQAYNVVNRFYMLKDLNGNDGSGQTTTTEANLFDATSTDYDGTLDGYYVTFATGEKVVNAANTVAGYTYFATNTPDIVTASSCTTNLGRAKGYRLKPFAGSRTYVQYDGGGMPPSPVAGLVNVEVNGTERLVPFCIGCGGDTACVGADCKSSVGGGKPPIEVSTNRNRTYWYNEID